MRMRGIVSVWGAIIALSVTACASGAPVSATSSGSTIVSIPTPVSTPSPVASPSDVVFGGDCAGVLENSALAAAWPGSALLPVDSDAASPNILSAGVAVRQVGGLSCGWSQPHAGGGNGNGLTLVALPASVPSTVTPGVSCSDGQYCWIGVDGDGVVVSGLLIFAPGLTGDRAREIAENVVTALGVPESSPITDGGPKPTPAIDCDAWASAAGVDAHVTPRQHVQYESGGELDVAGYLDAQNAADLSGCYWKRGGDTLFAIFVREGVPWAGAYLASATNARRSGDGYMLEYDSQTSFDVIHGTTWFSLVDNASGDPAQYASVLDAIIASG